MSAGNSVTYEDNTITSCYFGRGILIRAGTIEAVKKFDCCYRTIVNATLTVRGLEIVD